MAPKKIIEALKRWFGILACRLGMHKYVKTPILADLDTYWIQGGKECCQCGDKQISFEQVKILVADAYRRGKQRSETSFLAYGQGVKKVVSLYGRAHTHKLVDEAEEGRAV